MFILWRKIKISVGLGLILPAATLAMQESAGNFRYSVDKYNNHLTFLSTNKDSLPLANTSVTLQSPTITTITNSFIGTYGPAFGIENAATELQRLSQTTDNLEMTHIRYQQIHQGIPVFGAQLILHLNKDFSLQSVNGRLVPDISVNTTPDITHQTATELAKTIWTQDFDEEATPLLRKVDMYILNQGLIKNTANTTNYLVWEIELYNTTNTLNEFYYIDAHTSELVYQLSGIQQINRQVYDCSNGWSSGYCYLDETVGPNTLGRSEGQSARGANPYHGGTDVDDLYDMYGDTHNYFLETFGLNGANNLGGLGDGYYSSYSNTDGYTYVEYDQYGGLCAIACFTGYAAYFYQGLVHYDVVAHEYMHGVTMWAIPPEGLTYSYESGALNESYSDIFGEAVEYYATGSNDWLTGADVDVVGLDGPLRSLIDPASLNSSVTGDPYPEHFNDEHVYCGASDGGGVHHNSSVVNHAAYLTAMGGTYNNCTIEGIGRAKQEQIFYRALTEYMVASTDFNGAYDALLAACYDLYNNTDCAQLKKTLQAVELDQPGYCSGVPAVTPGCEAIDTPAVISSITSNTPAGTYHTGDIIDIDITFSKAVTSNGTVTVTLETGDTDQTCTFTLDNTSTGTCNYIVQSSDTSTGLTINELTGTISDEDGNTLVYLSPLVNLDDYAILVINPPITATEDIVAPTGKIRINKNKKQTYKKYVNLYLKYSDDNEADEVMQMKISNNRKKWTPWQAVKDKKQHWNLTRRKFGGKSTYGRKYVYVKFKDPSGNISKVYKDSIRYKKKTE